VSLPLLVVRNLTVSYPDPSGLVRAAQGVSFEIAAGETLGLVGETGCGKSTVALSIVGLLDGGRIETGEILFQGRNLAGLEDREWPRVRGPRIGTVFQDARGALNPVLTVGRHLVETLRTHTEMTAAEAWERSAALLGETGLPDPSFIMRRHSFELSGGACQRVGIALALSGNPELLVADEPTSALDPTIQAQILSLLEEMRARRSLALLFISHDLPLVSQIAGRTAVMYAGRIVEYGPAHDVFSRPAHPYTRALLACIPDLSRPPGSQRLEPIPGWPGAASLHAAGCAFAARCPTAVPDCTASVPPPVPLSDSHWAACIRVR
jgi:oligopeptide/dipeptide ABC transporter ATP-binding protein